MKIKIDKHNYELYVIDYIENNLPQNIRQEFEIFLHNNPQIREEIQLISENFTISPDNLEFDNKISLKKSPIDDLPYIDYLIISKIEQTISPTEEKELKNNITHNPQFKILYQSYQQTILPKQSITFPFKNHIKKHTLFATFAKKFAQIAAIVVLLIALTFPLKDRILFKPNRNSKTDIAFNYQYKLRTLEYKSNPTNSEIKSNITLVNKTKQVTSENSDTLISPTLIAFVENENLERNINIQLTATPNTQINLEITHTNTAEVNKYSEYIRITSLVNLVLKGMYWMNESNNLIQIDKKKDAQQYALQLNQTKYWINLE